VLLSGIILLQITTAVKSAFLIDDHIVFRNGLRMMLEAIPGLQVTGESSSTVDLVGVISAARPDIVFMDVHLQKVNCFTLTARLHQLFPDMLIVLMSMFSELGYQVDGKQAGANAILFKPSVGDSLENLLNTLLPGEFNPRVKFLSDL